MKRYSIYLMTLLTAAGCSEMGSPVEEEPAAALSGISTKVLNTPDMAVEGMLMVKMGDSGSVSALGTDFRAIAGATIEKAFHVTDRNAERLAKSGLDKWYVVRFDKGVSLSAAASSLAESPEIAAVQFNRRMTLFGTDTRTDMTASGISSPGGVSFNDPMLPQQWNYINMGSPSLSAVEGADVNVKDAWGLTGGDPSVIVAVLDEGVKYSHPDLAANMWMNTGEISGDGADNDGNGYIDDIYGYNFYSDTTVTWAAANDTGHGTHVAGTIAAVNNNGTGVCGVAGGTGNNDGVRIMSCQIFDDNNGGDELSVARAFVYAADNGAAIASCSFGYTDNSYFYNDYYYGAYSSLEKLGIDYFLEYGGGDVLDGGLVIFAAGNEAATSSAYPGAYAGCVSVAAVGPDCLPPDYTNYGPGVNISAPGGDLSLSSDGRSSGILSTIPSELSESGAEYAYYAGTSMACPHVSGVAALGLSYARKLGVKYEAEEFRNLLLSSVNDIEAQLDRDKSGMNLYNYHGKMGTGLIDAWKLLMNVEGVPSVMVPVGNEALVDLSPVLGLSADVIDTYYSAKITLDSAAKTALGVTGTPKIENGKLKIKCSSTGSAKATVTLVIDYKDDDGSPTDFTYLTREISILSRGVSSSNGGWL